MSSDVIRVLIADDQALVRGGFSLMLGTQPDLEVVGEVADGRAAVAAAAALRPELILMDVRMPEMDGIAATREVIACSPLDPPKILMLTTFDLDEYVYEAMRAGASGFLLKDVSPPDLMNGIRTVVAGEALLSPAIVRRLVDQYVARPLPSVARSQRLTVLTDRELDVLERVARGRSNAEIAGELYLSTATIKTHVAHILAKLGVRDRVHAVIAAYETGLIAAGQ